MKMPRRYFIKLLSLRQIIILDTPISLQCTPLGRYPESIEALNQNIALRPSAEAYANLCYTYFLMHRFADAVAASEQVKPSDRAWQNWGNLADALYWLPNRRTEANEAYRKAVSLALSEVEVNPKASETLAYLADYYAMLGDRNSAFKLP